MVLLACVSLLQREPGSAKSLLILISIFYKETTTTLCYKKLETELTVSWQKGCSRNQLLTEKLKDLANDGKKNKASNDQITVSLFRGSEVFVFFLKEKHEMRRSGGDTHKAFCGWFKVFPPRWSHKWLMDVFPSAYCFPRSWLFSSNIQSVISIPKPLNTQRVCVCVWFLFGPV